MRVRPGLQAEENHAAVSWVHLVLRPIMVIAFWVVNLGPTTAVVFAAVFVVVVMVAGVFILIVMYHTHVRWRQVSAPYHRVLLRLIFSPEAGPGG